MYKAPEIQGMSIVLLGSFNPKIFHPVWFAAQKLIREKEAEEANIELITPAVAKFSLDWMRLQVIQEQFVIETTQEPYYEILRDLVIGTFNFLSHTPVTMLGINTQQHFKMHSEEEWHRLGHELVPKEKYWTPTLKKPGMRSLTIEGQRPDEYKGYIQVKIEPSTKIQSGIYISINDHYEAEKESNCNTIIDILNIDWINAEQRAEKIITHFMDTTS